MKFVVEKILDDIKFVRAEDCGNIVISNSQGYFVLDKEGKPKNVSPYAYIEESSVGGFVVEDSKGKHGFIDFDGNEIVPCVYEQADDFSYGTILYEPVSADYARYTLVNKEGKAVPFTNSKGEPLDEKYEKMYMSGNGQVVVSPIDQFDLAYHTDHVEGLFGLHDIDGRRIIEPQYIFMNPLNNGIYAVCKGKWEASPEFDYGNYSGRLWSHEMNWGIIDSQGNELTSFVFNEINNRIYSDGDGEEEFPFYFSWKDGAWGFIDIDGNWVTATKFNHIGYKFNHQGLFVFGNEDPNTGDNTYGVYDIYNNREVITGMKEIDFSARGEIIAEKEEGKYFCVYNGHAEELFSIEANMLFDALYDEYFTYRVGDKWGVVDNTGSILVEPQFDSIDTVFPSHGHGLIHIEVDKKVGIYNYIENRMVLEPKYKSIYWMRYPNLSDGFADCIICNTDEGAELYDYEGTLLLSGYKKLDLLTERYLLGARADGKIDIIHCKG